MRRSNSGVRCSLLLLSLINLCLRPKVNIESMWLEPVLATPFAHASANRERFDTKLIAVQKKEQRNRSSIQVASLNTS